MSKKKDYDVIVLGGGIAGCATTFSLARFTNVKSVLLLEKYPRLASLNSNSRSNSQTLHRGDIETNIDLEKVQAIRDAADMVTRYAETYLSPEARARIVRTYPKMILGVGEKEVAFLSERLARLAHLFPDLRALSRDELAKAEPMLAEGREEDVLAVTSGSGLAVDYGALAESFVHSAQHVPGKKVDALRGVEVKGVAQTKFGWPNPPGSVFEVATRLGVFTSRALVVSAGAHSLLFAKRMGHAQHLATLPVAGNFYWSRRPLLRGKVYTVQNPKLPFAAVHGDPDLNFEDRTRFGPTAKVLGVLERGHGLRTLPDFLKSFNFGAGMVATLWKELADPDVRKYLVRNNLVYGLPLLGKRAFVEDCRKIVPTLRDNDLVLARGIGGIRPQVVDTKARKLLKGEARIEGDDVVFNMTPSPGATNCLKNAEKDVRFVAKALDLKVDEEAYAKLSPVAI